MTTVRDRLWLWAQPVNAHGPHTRWKVPRDSRITPVEAAVYLGIPNVQLVWLWRPEAPEPLPSWRQYALPLAAMKRVVWGIAHGHGLSFPDHIFPLVQESPNVTGVVLDDFFTTQPDGRPTALDERQLEDVADRLRACGRALDLWGVVYEQDLGKPVAPYLARMDVLALFMWQSASIPGMEASLAELARLAPGKRRALGLYMWDYAGRQPMPVDLMARQCETALAALRAGEIEGIIFVASCICDLELEAVEWTRRWIAQVAEQPVA